MLLNLVFVKILVILRSYLRSWRKSEPADDERGREKVIYFSKIFSDIDLLLQE